MIPGRGWLRQKDCQGLEASLNYVVSSRPAQNTGRRGTGDIIIITHCDTIASYRTFVLWGY